MAQARVAHAAWLGVLAASAALPFLTVWAAPSTAVMPATAVRDRVGALPSVLTPWMLRVYLLVAAGSCCGWCSASGRSRGIRRDAQLVVAMNAGETALIRACAAQGTRLYETAAVAVPATAGAWRPSVFLPAGWRDLDADLVAAIVRHELAHVGRRAYPAIVAAEMVKALFWFHPIAWLACARLRWFEELACDGEAAGDDPLRYARALLTVARLAASRPPALALSGGSQLARRVDLLLTPPRRMSSWAWVALAAALAVLPLLPLVTFRVSALSVATGSTREARQAGTAVAMRPTISMTAAATPNDTPSMAETPNTSVDISRTSARPATTPSATPDAVIRSPRHITIASRRRGAAPSASLTASSARRADTACAITP